MTASRPGARLRLPANDSNARPMRLGLPARLFLLYGRPRRTVLISLAAVIRGSPLAEARAGRRVPFCARIRASLLFSARGIPWLGRTPWPGLVFVCRRVGGRLWLWVSSHSSLVLLATFLVTAVGVPQGTDKQPPCEASA